MHDTPLVISNVILLQYAAGSVYVTLTANSSTPPSSKQSWHLPQATVGKAQTSLSALESTLRSTIGLQDSDVSYREQLYTSEYQTPDTSVVCISYLYLSRGARWYKGDRQVGVFPVNKLPKLSATDKSILSYALDRLHAKTLYSTIINFLLPQTFDLSELQLAFETITRQKVDRRNFRKKIFSLDIVHDQKKKHSLQTEPTRYSFRKRDLDFLAKPFPANTRK